MNKKVKSEELLIAKKKLTSQQKEVEKRKEEKIIANARKAKRAAELVNANKELLLAKEKEKLVAELIITNKELSNQISISKKAEEKLRVSETQYRRLFESAKDGILILDANNGKIVDANPFLLKMVGNTLNEIKGKELWEIGTFNNIIASKEAFSELQKKEYIRFDDMPLVRKDGKLTSVEFISNVYKVDNTEVIQCNIRDITERKKIEKELLTAESELRHTFEVNPGIIAKADVLTGYFIQCNPAITSILGYSPKEFMAQPIVEFIHPDDRQRTIDEATKQQLGNSTIRFENRYICKAGNYKWLEWNVTRTYENGIVYAAAMNINERKLAESELIKAKEKAEESDRLKTAFLTNMSHEIRTPMNGILGFAELLKEPNLTSDDLQDYVQIIQISGARMLNTINNIVDISKIESGLIQVNINEANINEKMEFTYNFFKPEAEIKNLQFSFKNGLQSKDSIIQTDNEKVYGILTNLVKNAIKFTFEGSIELGYERKGEYLEFFVKDTGIGIPMSQRKIIFERFRQGSESHNRGYDGSGLGLSISKSYLEMLGGKIWVESEEGKGSTFYFTIPYNPISEEKTVIENTFYEKDKEVKLKKLKILIVEDDEISYSLLTHMLHNINCEVLHAITGVDAVEACKPKPDLDLIFMDIRMPRMDGNEATRQIRQFNKDVIIIAQTAYAFPGDKEKAIEAGCNSFITKPFNKTQVTELVKSYFN